MPDIGPLSPMAQQAAINAANSIAIPNVPTNCDTLVLNLATAIESANGQFHATAGQLTGVTGQVNGAVHNVLATYQGKSATALATTWQLTQTDGTNAHGPLIAISGHLSGAPAQLRAQVAAIQQGLAAIQAVQMTQRACLAQPVTPSLVQEWEGKISGLTNALNNVGLVLHGLAYGINALNQGFKKTCATGFIPGDPIPVFRSDAFGKPKPDGNLVYSKSAKPGVVSRLGSGLGTVGRGIGNGVVTTANGAKFAWTKVWNGTKWVVTLKWINPRWDPVLKRAKFFAGDSWRLNVSGNIRGKLSNMIASSLTVALMNQIAAQLFWGHQSTEQGTIGQFLATMSALGIGGFVDFPEAAIGATLVSMGIGGVSSAIHSSPQPPPFHPTTTNYQVGNATIRLEEAKPGQYTVTVSQPGKPSQTRTDLTISQAEQIVIDVTKAQAGGK